MDFPDEDEDDWDTSKGYRIMGVAYVPDFSQAAFACIVAPDGEVTDYLRLPSLLKRKNGFREDEKLQKVYYCHVYCLPICTALISVLAITLFLMFVSCRKLISLPLEILYPPRSHT